VDQSGLLSSQSVVTFKAVGPTTNRDSVYANCVRNTRGFLFFRCAPVLHAVCVRVCIVRVCVCVCVDTCAVWGWYPCRLANPKPHACPHKHSAPPVERCQPLCSAAGARAAQGAAAVVAAGVDTAAAIGHQRRCGCAHATAQV
jgi:hypothetical protein